VLSITESLENIEVDSVADLTVSVDVDVPFAVEMGVVHQVPGGSWRGTTGS